MKRRELLKLGVSLAAGTAALGTWDFDRRGEAAEVRTSVNGLDSSDPVVKNYAKAVDLMRKLPASDPRNWTAQAKIHNDFCPHYNWWFLPWHRAYLFYFENVCRAVLNDPTFALPYWDWTRYPRIPGPFLDKSSPLWDSTRNDQGNVQLADETVGSVVIAKIVSSTALVDLFSSPTTSDVQRQVVAAGQLEGTPHNGVHSMIGGDMGNFMSPLDPIFWLHHCNVDRIWASWAKLNNNLAPTASLWLAHSLSKFYDPLSKRQVTPATRDTLDAAKYGAVYDRYEGAPPSPIQFLSSLKEIMIGAQGDIGNVPSVRHLAVSTVTTRGIALGRAQQFQLPISQEFSALIQKAASPPQLAEAVRGAESFLLVESVPTPTPATTALRVFLNCKNPSLDTPLDDPTYVGTVAFFDGSHAEGHSSGITFSLNVTSTLSKVVKAGIYSAGTPIEAAILPVDLASPRRTGEAEIVKPASLRLVGIEAM